jgi:hypothetical protein
LITEKKRGGLGGFIAVICAWCKKKIGVIPEGNGVSHGICKECAQKSLEKFYKKDSTKK